MTERQTQDTPSRFLECSSSVLIFSNYLCGALLLLTPFVVFLIGGQKPASSPVCYLPLVFLWNFLISIMAKLQISSFVVSAFDFLVRKFSPIQRLYKSLSVCFLVHFYFFHISVFNPKSEDNGLWAKSGPIFANKILLKLSRAHVFRCVYGYFLIL